MIYGCSPTKKIYPFIANYFNSTPDGVERAIRTCIESFWSEIDDDIKKYFNLKVETEKQIYQRKVQNIKH